MQLKLSNNTITGNLAGKLIHCAVRISSGTGRPAPGEYVIRPPVSDPIFGQTALAIPWTSASAGFASACVDYFFKLGVSQTALKMGSAPAMKWAAPPVGYAAVHKWEAQRPGLASSAGGGAMESAGGAGAERQSATKGVLVLSDKPIAGSNCLVVMLGFADLMQGLAASGGATLIVS